MDKDKFNREKEVLLESLDADIRAAEKYGIKDKYLIQYYSLTTLVHILTNGTLEECYDFTVKQIRELEEIRKKRMERYFSER